MSSTVPTTFSDPTMSVDSGLPVENNDEDVSMAGDSEVDDTDASDTEAEGEMSFSVAEDDMAEIDPTNILAPGQTRKRPTTFDESGLPEANDDDEEADEDFTPIEED